MGSVRIIRQSYIIHAPVSKVWEVLVGFKLWDENIHSKSLEVIPKKKLVQEWRIGKRGKASGVTIALTYENGRTYIDLLHEEVPEREWEEINKSWKENYFGPIKRLVEQT